MNNQAQYVIDATASQFTVQVFASGLVSILAHSPKFAMRDFGGEVRLIPETLGQAFLRMRIKASSLEIMDEMDGKNRREIARIMFQEVLETPVFPEIRFESVQVTAGKVGENRFSATVMGNLSMHGVTKSHSFTTQVVMGPDTLRGVGEFKLKQTDYGIALPSFPGGTLRDDVKLAFYIIAHKQGAPR
jgi:polyisoprenoid-binding protein YceI